MSVWRNGIIIFSLLLLAGCHRQDHWCEPQLHYSIASVEEKYGVPNQIISRSHYTWYGYVTKLQSDYPLIQTNSCPHKTIGLPVPVTHSAPGDSFARYGCAVWFKADKHGVVTGTKRTGKHCTEADYRRPVGN